MVAIEGPYAVFCPHGKVRTEVCQLCDLEDENAKLKILINKLKAKEK